MVDGTARIFFGTAPASAAHLPGSFYFPRDLFASMFLKRPAVPFGVEGFYRVVVFST
jgi:hypothetical protein